MKNSRNYISREDLYNTVSYLAIQWYWKKKQELQNQVQLQILANIHPDTIERKNIH